MMNFTPKITAHGITAANLQGLYSRVAGVFGFFSTMLICSGVQAQWGWGWGAPGSYHHASTVEEGFQRGLADTIRSTGAANLMSSKALINVEEARSKSIDNRLKSVENFYEIKRHNQEYKKYTRAPKINRQQMFEIARARAPQRLSPSQIDPLTGQIQWPAALQAEEFKQGRQRLDAIFADRAKHNNSSDPDTLVEVGRIVGSMQAQLKDKINQYPSYVYIGAKKFLDGISFESANPVY